MQYFIKEWPNHTASIFAEDGYLLATLQSLKHAIQICREECLVDPMWVESPFFVTRRSYLQHSQRNSEHRFIYAA